MKARAGNRAGGGPLGLGGGRKGLALPAAYAAGHFLAALWAWRGLGLLLLAISAGPTAGQQAQPSAEKARLVAQVGHSKEINAIALTPDGKYLVTGSQDDSVRLWDAETGKEVRRFPDPDGWINDLVLSRDGKYVLYGGLNGVARLAETLSGKEIRRFDPKFRGDIVSVEFSPDEKNVLTGSSHGTVVLWDLASGNELRRIEAHKELLKAAAYSPDGQFVLTASTDKTARLWEVATGLEVRRYAGHTESVEAVAFSPDGRYVITGSQDKTARVWATRRFLPIGSGKELLKLEHSSWAQDVAFSPDGKEVITRDYRTARFWDAQSGKELRQIKNVKSLAFSSDGRKLVTGSGVISNQKAVLWDVATGQELQRFEADAVRIHSVALSPDGKQLLLAGEEGTTLLLDTTTGNELRRLLGHTDGVRTAVFSADGREVLTASSDKTARLWETATGKELRRFEGHTEGVVAAVLSRDGQRVLTGGLDGTVRYWDARSGQELRLLEARKRWISSVGISPDGRQALTSGWDLTTKLWNLETGAELRQWKDINLDSIAFSQDGRRALVGASYRHAQLWDLESGNELRRYRADEVLTRAAIFSRDGKRVLTGCSDGTARVFDEKSAKELLVIRGHTDSVGAVALSADGERILTVSEDHTARLWDGATGKELCRMMCFRNGTHAIIDSDGRFDASNGGDVEGLHWVVGNEPIALKQLKERYYDPELLAKYMGFKREPLRDVAAFKEVKLYPEVTVAAPTAEKQKLGIELVNRGGGIGRVVVKINGKELTADARQGSGVRSQGSEETGKLKLEVELANDPRVMPGKQNRVEVMAFNAEGYLSSRGAEVFWEDTAARTVPPVELYAIVGGVSEYAEKSLALRFAGKDAEDMARAIEAGAKRLFGAEKVHVTLLVTSQDQRAKAPTKANFERAFKEVREKAKPEDVVVVYLAGHGVSLGRGTDLYCYATAEARNLDPAVLADSALREATTITSEELAEWTKLIPAQKQVLILDTCAAGAAAAKLTEKRDISGDQIRALDRLKDRTGFHVLLGCASDRVSYEASRYEQGLLTYSLLQGMRGAALREGEFVDVSKLFQYSADEVPQLAKDIGGIQAPMIFAPRGTSFDVGQLKAEDKQAIPLASVKALILRPLLIDPDVGDDSLGLLPLLKRRLNDESYAARGAGGRSGSIVFVDADELPGAIRPAGTYAVMGESVKVKMNLRRDGKTVGTFEVAGEKGQLGGLVERLVEGIGKGAAGVSK